MITCPRCARVNQESARYCQQCGAALGGSAVDPGSPVPIGTVFDEKYEVLAEIGRGGMGVVYLARDLRLDRRVAIKVLPEQFNTGRDLIDRFHAEARAMAQLDHLNIVPIYAIGQQGAYHYFVMKLLEGQTLADRLEQYAETSTRASPAEVRRLVVECCSALEQAHARGLIHRDVKPGNVMLALDGQATLMDFGLVKRRREDRRLTRTGLVYGTPEYIAPEQAQGREEPGPAADLYSLGVVAYEMISGQIPFDAPNPLDLVLKHLNEPPPPLCGRIEGVPRDLEGLILRALAKRPADRFGSAAAMGAAAARLELEDVAPVAPGPSPVLVLSRRRRPRRVEINCEFQSLEALQATYATDISTTGCFLHTTAPLPVGALVSLNFTILDLGMAAVEGEGEVVRVVSPPAETPGMGVRFTELTDESVACIQRLVDAKGPPPTPRPR